MLKFVIKQRQRLKMPLPSCRKNSRPITTLVLNLMLVAVQLLLLPNLSIKCQQQQPSDGGPNIGSLLLANSRQPRATSQYNNRHRSSYLVDNHQHIHAQSLPLTRQQLQGTELDNVIESTTSLLNLQRNVAANIDDPPEIGSGIVIAGACQLPPTWTGRWYQPNREPIRITDTEISDKGICRAQKSDKYLFEYSGSNKQQLNSPSTPNEASCLVCLRFIDRHLNALQYKESNCQPIPANYHNRSILSLLDSICDDINGDNPLESLFRLDTPTIECPINGRYTITNDKCRESQSTMNTCIDKKQLSFVSMGCPNDEEVEFKHEIFECYADWVDNSENDKYYMIGRLKYASNDKDIGKFRCFLYEISFDGKTIHMASQDESCNGLISPTDGPNPLRLTVKPPTKQKCHFPSYIQSQSHNWLSVDNSLIYMFDPNSTKYQVKETNDGSIIEEATCSQQFTHPHSHHLHPNSSQHQFHSDRRYPPSTSSHHQADQQQQQSLITKTNDVVYLVQITKNCHAANFCVRFYKRTNGIVQIDYFVHTPKSDHPCKNAYTKETMPQTQIITSTNLEYQRCPFEGAYTMDAPVESAYIWNPSNIFLCPSDSFMTAQCDHSTRLSIHSKCTPYQKFTENLNCLGSWRTNGLVRLLLADDKRQRYSAWYKDYALPLSPAAQEKQPDGSSSLSPTMHSIGMGRLKQPAAQLLVDTLYAPIVDLQIAMITPTPMVVKPMQVRLTRRNPCSDIRGYTNQGSYSGSSSSSMPSYAPSLTAQSGAASTFMVSKLYCQTFVICSLMALLIVNSLVTIAPIIIYDDHRRMCK